MVISEADLRSAIYKGESARLIKQAAIIDETDRRSLARQSLAISQEVRRLVVYGERHGKEQGEQRFQQWFKKKCKNSGEQFMLLSTIHCASDVARVLFCDAEDMPVSLFWGMWGAGRTREQHIVAAMEQRSSTWKHAYFSSVRLNAYYGLSWKHFWAIMRNGTDARIMDERYCDYFKRSYEYLALDNNDNSATYISDRLKVCGEVCEHDIWVLFKFNNYVFELLKKRTLKTSVREQEDARRTDDKGSALRMNRAQSYMNRQCWYEALYNLVEEGFIQRSQLLDECLLSMSRPLSAVMLSNILVFFNNLHPTAEELAHRGAAFVDIIRHGKGKVVVFALKQMRVFLDKGQLDYQKFFCHLSAIIKRSPKGQLKTIVQLLHEIAQADVHAAPQVLEYMQAVIDCSQKGLQQYAIDMRYRVSGLEGDDHAQGEVCADVCVSSTNIDETHSLSLNDFYKRRKLLPVDIVLQGGLDVGGDMNTPLPPLCERGERQAVLLKSDDVLIPVCDVKELVRLVAQYGSYRHNMNIGAATDICEKKYDAWATDKIADGLMRLYCTDDTRKILSLDEVHELQVLDEAMRTVSSLCHEIRASCEWNDKRYVSLTAAVPSLSLPTHQSGWIDPRDLVGRYSVWNAHGMCPMEDDGILAFCRLAPIFRGEALQLLNKSVKVLCPYGRALAWALEDDRQQPSRTDQAQEKMWIAAGRVRQPYGDIVDLSGCGFRDYGANTLQAADMSWYVETRQRNIRAGIYEDGLAIRFTYEKKDENIKPFGFPYSHLYQSDSHRGQGDEFIDVRNICYSYTQSMCNDDGYWATVVWRLSRHMESNAQYSIENTKLFDALVLSQRPCREVIVLALMLSLVMKRVEFQDVAVSIIASFIADEKFNEEVFSTVTVQLLNSSWIKINRLSQGLLRIADMSQLHSLRIAHYLEQSFLKMKKAPKRGHCLFSLAEDMNARVGYHYRRDTCKYLNTVKWTPAIRSTLKRMLSKVDDNTAELQWQLYCQRLEIRLAQAERFVDTQRVQLLLD